MDFNLSKAGSRSFVSSKPRKTIWNDGNSVMSIGSQFIFSKDLCEKLKVDDGNILSFFDKEDGLYLANITSKITKVGETKHETTDGIIFRRDCLHLTNVQTVAQKGKELFYKARKASNSYLVTSMAKENEFGHSYDLGDYNAGELVDAPFPCVKLSLVVEVVEIVEVTNEVVDNIENLVGDVAKVHMTTNKEAMDNATDTFIKSNVDLASTVQGAGNAW